MRPKPQPPEWLIPGAEVVTWYPFASARHSVKLTKVKSVAGSTFAVEDEREPRYKIDTLDATVGEGWSRTSKWVAHADSVEGVYWIAVRDVEHYLSRADSATVTWQRERTRHAAADLQHALALWIAGVEYLDTLTEPRRTR
jgi:hypothetical protein